MEHEVTEACGPSRDELKTNVANFMERADDLVGSRGLDGVVRQRRTLHVPLTDRPRADAQRDGEGQDHRMQPVISSSRALRRSPMLDLWVYDLRGQKRSI
jgi:hypothetical protein